MIRDCVLVTVVILLIKLTGLKDVSWWLVFVPVLIYIPFYAVRSFIRYRVLLDVRTGKYFRDK